MAAALLAVLALAPLAGAANDPERSRQWGLDMIEADAAHQTTTGSGAVVAVIDTGVDAAHQDLAGRLLPGHDFVDKDDTPQDGNGHGTHVTGIVAADTGNGIGVSSVAPGAQVLPIRVLDDSGSGTDADVIAGIDYAISKKVDVINLSLGGLPVSALDSGGDFAAALQRAVDAGIVVVAAAGNDSLPICEQPGIQGKMLCVGAVDKRGMRSFFSSGDGAAIMAPGGSAAPGTDEDVLSTLPGNQYGEIAGTSQATPHVSGVAALLVQHGLHGQAVVDRVLATASDAGVPGPDPVYGVGIVNARAAVAGLGGGGSGGSGSGSGGSARGGISLHRVQHFKAVLSKGIRSRCHATAAGACSITVKHGATIANGSHTLKKAGTATLTVRPTAAGRKLLQRGHAFTATATLVAPGAAKRTVQLTFRR
ncbi:MAG: serine protease [Thermoleophilaceae bacterium]|nr:serine protease [Thermoleophilaceae bacterium]